MYLLKGDKILVVTNKVNLIFQERLFSLPFSFFFLFDMISVNTIKVFDKNRQELLLLQQVQWFGHRHRFTFRKLHMIHRRSLTFDLRHNNKQQRDESTSFFTMTSAGK